MVLVTEGESDNLSAGLDGVIFDRVLTAKMT